MNERECQANADLIAGLIIIFLLMLGFWKLMP